MGVIPKKHQLGKWHLIVDLWHPENHSVNAGLSSEICSLTYLKLDEVAETVVTFGQGAQLAKSTSPVLIGSSQLIQQIGTSWDCDGRKNLCGRSTIIRAQISTEDFYSTSRCGNLETKVVRNKVRRPLLGRLDHNR